MTDVYSFLAHGFVGFCEIPDDLVSFSPVNKEEEREKKYSPIEAMHIGDDGYLHCGLRIILFEAPNVFPHQPIVIDLCLTELDEKIMVKVSGSDKPRQLHLNNEGECSSFYEHLVDGVKRYFSSAPHFDSSLKKIGFGRE
jgi:hypothetical protein